MSKYLLLTKCSDLLLLGGNADLCGLLDSLDPVCSGVSGVGVQRAGHGAHPRVRYPHPAGQVLSHVQPHHLPARGPKKLVLILLFEGHEET